MLLLVIIMKEYLNDEELFAVYPQSDKFWSGWSEERKRKVGIYLLKPINSKQRLKYLDQVRTEYQHNKEIRVKSHHKTYAIYRSTTGNSWVLPPINDLKSIKLPFGFRDAFKLEIIPEIGKLAYNNYLDFLESLDVQAKELDLMQYVIEKNRETLLSIWKSQLNVILKQEYATNSLKSPEGKVKLIVEAVHNVLFSRIKLAYAGMVGEAYAEVLLRSNPLVYDKKLFVYKTNKEADGMGIDYMITDGVKWYSLAITKTDEAGQLRNRKCDICLPFTDDFSFQEDIKNSFVKIKVNHQEFDAEIQNYFSLI